MLFVLVGAMLILISLLALLIIIIGIVFVLDLFLELPYVGTRRSQIKTIMDLAQIKEGKTVIDLGSGDGRLLIEAAKRGAFSIGYEINPLLIWFTLIHAKLSGLKGHVKVYKTNLWKADLALADVIFVYAMRKSMPKFEDFIYKNAKNGTRVIVNMNPFPGKKHLKTKNNIFLYRV